MKKILILTVLSIATLFLFTSCASEADTLVSPSPSQSPMATQQPTQTVQPTDGGIPGMMDTRINTQKDTPIKTISLNYILKTDEKGLPRLTPVWVFDIDQKAARQVITDDNEYLARAAMDLFFSAETGQLEAVW